MDLVKQLVSAFTLSLIASNASAAAKPPVSVAEKIDDGMTVNVASDKSGTWIVTIPGSAASGNLGVGYNSAGTMIVDNRSKVENYDATVGEIAGSNGIVIVSGAGSVWQNNYILNVGNGGNGTLEIQNGGSVTSTHLYLAYGHADLTDPVEAASSGRLIITGRGSSYNVAETLTIGNVGTGYVHITDNGLLQQGRFAIVGNSGKGTVDVDNGGVWSIGGELAVGHNTVGTLNIGEGGTVTSVGARIARFAKGDGTINIVGSNASWTNTGDATIAVAGKGTLSIAEGGRFEGTANLNLADSAGSFAIVRIDNGAVSVANGLRIGRSGSAEMQIEAQGSVTSANGVIGENAGSTGSVSINGSGAKWVNTDQLTIGSLGTATLTLSQNGRLESETIYLAQNPVSQGTLAIGAQSGQAADDVGSLKVRTINLGDGDSRLVLNHTSADFVFDKEINGGQNNIQGSGTGIIGSGIIENIAGRTILNADQGDFYGTLLASGGFLQINGNLSNAALNITTDGTVEGHGHVGNTMNAGRLSLNGVGNVFFVDGNYQGQEGTVSISTVLGDSTSQTDLLKINGDVTGHSLLEVTNRGGLGAITIGDGIKVIEVLGQSPETAFSLASDYKYKGRKAIVGGAYAYSLYHNGIVDSSDGNWYLRSLYDDTPKPVEPDPTEPGTGEPAPVYSPAVPLYEVYPQILQQLNRLGTLEQRVGNRTWLVGEAKEVTGQERGFWMKVEGATGHVNAARSATEADYNFDTVKTLFGVDFVAFENEDGRLIAGTYFQYGHAKGDIWSRFGRGNIKTDGYGLGGTLTWYGENGFYIDSVAQAMWYDSDIRSSWLSRDKLINGNDGTGYSLSVETGRKIVLNGEWTMTPQAQLSYSSVDFDSFHDSYDVRVKREGGDELRGRVGIAFNKEKTWKSEAGDMRRLKTYGIGNLSYQFLNGTEVDVADVNFRNRSDRIWSGLGTGVSYNWKDDVYSLYGELEGKTSIKDFGDSYALSGTAGFKIKW
ncbi:autotransporter outer membrane beta-barrel domain-containing protein [Bartonella sp. LJL80]